MSGGPIWAITEPSTNSTSECTIDCGWITTSMRSRSRPKRWCSSITSSALFIKVAEPIVMRGPMLQLGCLSAASGLARSSSSRVALRNGPPLAVRITRRTRSRRSPRRHWKMAECSLSTGTIVAPCARASGIKSAPASTSDSLLARASVLPRSSTATEAGRPAAPTTPCTATSYSHSRAISSSAFAPRKRRVPAWSSGARRSAAASSRSATQRGRKRAHWPASFSQEFSAARPATTRPPALSCTRSSVWVPMEPVLPSTSRDCMRVSGRVREARRCSRAGGRLV